MMLLRIVECCAPCAPLFFAVSCLLSLPCVESPLRAADVIISEFMASNSETLDDEDGDSSDWIELYNGGAETIDLDGWYLTDDAGDLTRWRFPAVTMDGGSYLLVFASEKDRRIPGTELHSNFKLSSSGELIILIEPDGQTIASVFAPPEQLTDISYGIGQRVDIEHLLAAEASMKVLVPSSDADGTQWTGADPFDDSSWIEGVTGAGYVTTVPGFAVRNFRASVNVSRLSIAEEVIAEPGMQIDVNSENTPVIDYLGTPGGGHYPGNRPFPGMPAGVDFNNFVIEARAVVTIPVAGNWTFGVNSDDGFGLELSSPEGTFYVEYPNPRGSSDTLGVFDVPVAGDYALRLVMYEAGGGSSVELFAARGNFASWSGANFRLVGDTAGGGLAVESDVSSENFLLNFSSLIGVDLGEAMLGVNSSAYLRMPFDVADPGALETLTLRINYDDGFVAYLNGVEIARRNAPALLAYDSTATLDRSATDAGIYEDVNISAQLDQLRVGSNILAIHGLNASASSNEFLIYPELAEIVIESGVPTYFDEPTPGRANTTGFVDVVRDTKFSIDRGFYESAFDLEISSETAGAEIRYTLDGSAPTETSGSMYSGPIRISETTTIRAMAHKRSFISTNVDTHTYIFLDDIIRQDYAATLDAGFPATWGGVEPDYGIDPEVVGQDGQDVFDGEYAASIVQDLLAVPTMSIVMKTDLLFGGGGIYTNSGGRGPGWERACSVELIHPDGRKGFQVNAGIRMQGGAFRNHSLTKKHSVRLLFKREYGPTKLRYPLFGRFASAEFDTITVRANANDSWRGGGTAGSLYLRDSFGRETLLAMGRPASHEAWVHLYLNGVYWGLYNPVERPDADFSSSYFVGDKDDWDAISTGGNVSHGNRSAWDALFSLAAQGLSSDASYQAIQGRRPDGSDDPALESYLDVEHYIDYMITNQWGGNGDWPHNNYWAGRRKIDSTGFKFYIWDAEGVLRGTGSNRVSIDNGVAVPYAEMRQNAEFRMLFADHLHRHISPGGALYVDPANPDRDPERPERNLPAERLARLTQKIDRAIVGESARWGDQKDSAPLTRRNWLNERDSLMSNYLPRRTAIVIGQFRAGGLYPATAAPRFSQHGGDIPSSFELFILFQEGVTYYTTSGVDPRLPGGAISPQALEAGSAEGFDFIREGADCFVSVPASGVDGLDWTLPGFDDSNWRTGRTGVGYENSSGYENFILTDVGAEMSGVNSSVYIRIPFEFDGQEAALSFLTLRMMYDDGFVAYLNGERIASRNAPEILAWNSAAAGNASDAQAVIFEPIDVGDSVSALVDGLNVLAIHGLNVSTGSSDMLIVPELVASVSTGGGIILNGTTQVKARTLQDGEWSALTEATFVLGGASKLRITEIMYHPHDPPLVGEYSDDDFEFLELRNTGDLTIDLDGVRLDGGVDFDFSTSRIQFLAPGDFLVLVENEEAFGTRYDAAQVPLAGQYRGRLDNLGEELRLTDARGQTILEFPFSDKWFLETDGMGYSLVIEDETISPLNWRHEDRWRASFQVGGSPGTEDFEDGIPRGWQRPGDTNQDGTLDISDGIALLLRLFAGAAGPLPCDGKGMDQGGNLIIFDLNSDDSVDISDAIYLLAYQFQGGAEPQRGTRCVRLENCDDVCRP